MKIKPMLGEFALNDIEYIESSESRALVEHRVPGLAGNYFQDMGAAANTIVIAGTKSGDEARDNFLTGIREIFNKGEQTTFVADINTATDITDVVIEDLEVAETGGRADSFSYLIKLRKYTKPPEPPQTSLLDEGILGDALNVVDALNALDALSSISNLGDPTGPVRGALDSVKAATGGLDQTVSDLRNLFTGEAASAPAPSPGAAGGGPSSSGPQAPVSSAPTTSGTVPSSHAPSAPGPPPEVPRIDPADPRIDAATGPALQSMLEAPDTADTAARLIQGVNGGTLAGILGDDSDVAQQLAAAHGMEPSQLIPPGQDAALVLDAASPLEAPSAILLRNEIHDDPVRLAAALEAVGRTFQLFKQGEVGLCESADFAVVLPNLVPSTFCHVPAAVPGPVEEKPITRGLFGMFFETDKTFLLPSAMRSIRLLNRFYKDNPSVELLVVGHTDTVGPEQYNLELSKRRAENMAAYLEDKFEIWTAYYQPQHISKQWDTREDQHMLSVLPEGGEPFYTAPVDGIAGPSTIEAITQFQKFSNANRGATLTVDGVAGPNTRRELVKAYMELDGTSLPEGTPLFSQGCGEFHSEVATGDEVPESRNRRTEVFFFPEKIDPPMPVGGCRSPGCVEYPQWRDRARRTIDFTKEPGSLVVQVSDESTVQPISEANVALSGIESRAAQTDDFGEAFFEQLIPGEYTVLASKEGFEAEIATVLLTRDQEHTSSFTGGPDLAPAGGPAGTLPLHLSPHLPLIHLARVFWQGQQFALFENAAKHKVVDPITGMPITKGGIPIELPAENFARGPRIKELPTVRPGQNAQTQHAVCCRTGDAVKLLVDLRNPSRSEVKGTLTAMPTLSDTQGNIISGVSSTSVNFEGPKGNQFIAVDITLGNLPDKMGLFQLEVKWEAKPSGSVNRFRFGPVTTKQHIVCIIGSSPLDPIQDKPVPISDTGSGTHHRLSKLFSVIRQPTIDVNDVIWRIHEAVNNSTPPHFFNELGIEITHNGDIKKHFVSGAFVGTGFPLPLQDQWLMWVVGAGAPPYNRAACAGYVQLVKTMLNLLGIPIQRKLLLPVTKQMPPSTPGGSLPAPLDISSLTLTSDVIIAPAGLNVSASIQTTTLKGLDGKDYKAQIALMKDNKAGEFFEACAVTSAGKFLPGGFNTSRVVAMGAPKFVTDRGFNNALEAVRWWTQTSTLSGFKRFMCWVALDDDKNLLFAWDVDGKAYKPNDYVKIRDTGKQLPPP
ncbi:MAG: OmpA family protein [Blastocatellia bacterium]